MRKPQQNKTMYKISFKEEFSVFDIDGTLTLECNSVTLINIGTTDIIINGCLTIVPGAQYVSDGNVTEVNKSLYQIQLNGSRLVVIRKNYTNELLN